MKSVPLCITLFAIGATTTSALAQTPLTNADEARAWYIAMMVENDCSMTQFEIRDSLETAFPYDNAALRESGFMAADAGMALVSEGLLTMPGGTLGLVYTGLEC